MYNPKGFKVVSKKGIHSRNSSDLSYISASSYRSTPRVSARTSPQKVGVKMEDPKEKRNIDLYLPECTLDKNAFSGIISLFANRKKLETK